MVCRRVRQTRVDFVKGRLVGIETSRPACSEPIASIGCSRRIRLGQAIIPMSRHRFVSRHYKLTGFANREEGVKRRRETKGHWKAFSKGLWTALTKAKKYIGNRRKCRPILMCILVGSTPWEVLRWMGPAPARHGRHGGCCCHVGGLGGGRS